MKNPERAALSEVRVAGVMSKALITLHIGDTMRRAAAVLLDNSISGAPVLNYLDQPVGVLTKTDIARYEREFISVREAPSPQDKMQARDTLENIAQEKGFHPVGSDDHVQKWMTPAVYVIDKGTPLTEAVRAMAQKRVHRLFVKDSKSQKLVGVITPFDLLRALSRWFKKGVPLKRPGEARAVSK
ncbi:MAG: hypothetical protein A3G41_08480 [Elusimicrobia bacterium RIFCSPLOWO2_12_FULL_59_9]|nr:MAG: hypothetical protein A3G41_08480 [Elusimicrobia bacterium RIFCSPLOWO2_12_FULL_59_9]